MPAPTITALPDAPSRNDLPATFVTKADAFVAALAEFVSDANAQAAYLDSLASGVDTDAATASASALTAVNAPGTSGTSTTSNSIGTGSKTFTTQTGKAWVVGQVVTVARTSDAAASWMHGTITAYNGGTGSITVNVTKTAGSGTFTDWTVGLSGPAGADGGGTSGVTTNMPALSGGTSTVTALRIVGAAGQLDSGGQDDTVDAQLILKTGQFLDVSGTYFDPVLILALNSNASLNPVNVNMPSVGLALEGQYRLPGLGNAVEHHLWMKSIDGNVEFRSFTTYVPHLTTHWATQSQWGVRGATGNIADGSGNVFVLFNAVSGARTIELTQGGGLRAPRIQSVQNNVTVIEQLNAAGTGYNFAPYFNASNRLYHQAAESIQQPMAGGSLLGVGQVARERQISGQTADGIQDYVSGSNAVTGSLIGEWRDADATAAFYHMIRNLRAGGQTGFVFQHNAGGAFLGFENTAAGLAGPQIRVTVNGLEIHGSGYRGGAATTPAQTISQSTGQTSFSYALRLANSTTALLPSAATAGAGALAASTDAGAPMYSNGAAWLDLLDRANHKGTRQVYVSTDFLSSATDGAFVTAAISGGANSNTPPNTIIGPNHPGVILWRSSATPNSGYYSHTNLVALLRIGGGEVWNVRFAPPASFTGTLFRSGFGDTLTATEPTDGIYLRFNGSGAIVGVCRSNSSESATATITTLSADTWYHGRITVNPGATSVLFEVFADNGTLLGSASLTTNIPTAAGREVGFGSVATNSGSSAVDLVYMDQQSFEIIGRSISRGAA